MTTDPGAEDLRLCPGRGPGATLVGSSGGTSMSRDQPRSGKDVEAARTRRSQLFVLGVLTLLAAGVALAAGLMLVMLRAVQLP